MNLPGVADGWDDELNVAAPSGPTNAVAWRAAARPVPSRSGKRSGNGRRHRFPHSPTRPARLLLLACVSLAAATLIAGCDQSAPAGFPHCNIDYVNTAIDDLNAISDRQRATIDLNMNADYDLDAMEAMPDKWHIDYQRLWDSQDADYGRHADSVVRQNTAVEVANLDGEIIADETLEMAAATVELASTMAELADIQAPLVAADAAFAMPHDFSEVAGLEQELLDIVVESSVIARKLTAACGLDTPAS